MILPVVAAVLAASTPMTATGGSQAPTTRYQAIERNGRAWIVTPKGDKLFSLGVCVVEPGESFADYDPAKPGYAAFRYYDNASDWSKDTVERLQRWGFNTIGAWSKADLLRVPPAPKLNFTPILHIGSSAGAPWVDMWEPATVKLMDDVAKSQILPLKGDNRVIGYFSDNEQGWWYGALFDWGWKGKTSRHLMTSLFRARYHKSWSSLCRDFVPDRVASFDELEKRGRLYLRPGGNGIKTVQAWISILADRYYSLCQSIIKKYDPHALYLGDRYISNFYPEVAKASAKYVDVCSTNLNADWIDGTFARFYLPTLRRLTGRPIMITEYYACARENRSGNKNNSSGFPTVQTQKDRARIALVQTRALLRTPYVVGAHWFQYSDEPTFGRGDGENYDFGLVDIDNKPYEEVVSMFAGLNLNKEHLRTEPAPSDAVRGIPTVAKACESDLNAWPRDRAFVPPSGLSERGDLYIAWSEGALYLGVYWNEDRFAEAFYRDGKVPTQEHARLTLKIDGAPRSLDLETTPLAISRTLGVRSWAILKLPIKNLRAGKPITFSATVTTRARAYATRWHGKYTLSK